MNRTAVTSKCLDNVPSLLSKRRGTLLGLACATTLTPLAPLTVSAQGAVQSLIEEVTVTARKKSDVEAAQDVPVSVTAMSGKHLEATFARDLQSLSFTMPNVALDDIGTVGGTANFSIRGLGINSSIPSIDPTVGVFVDGMYLGINAGVVFDLFDLEGIEVLRGPQGVLFGRNVTGGAVLIKTRKPTDELDTRFKVSFEEGLEKTVAGSVSGPLVDGTLSGRITAYYNDDDGWFDNDFDGGEVGAEEILLVRPSLRWTPTDDTEITIRFEHGESDGDGSVPQNRGVNRRDTFDVAYEETGFVDTEWNQVTAELNWDVAFGDGTVTHVFGWREYDSDSRGDIDATLGNFFTAPGKLRQDQLSHEIRYAGRFFDRLDMTAGFYYFTQDIEYFENRQLFTEPVFFPSMVLPPTALINSTLGGTQDQTTLAFFTNADIELNPEVTMTLGLRYTYEKKEAEIATFRGGIFLAPGVPLPAALGGVPSACDFDAETCNFDFVDDANWNNVTPKVGMQWHPTDEVLLYTFWTKGFRSGGYNFRNTSLTFRPARFDEEEQSSVEVGAKADWMRGRLRTNVAFFHNEIDDMQRELNLADPLVGVVQLIRNTADATIQGVEFDARFVVLENLLVMGSLGYVDGEYDEVRFDLTGDGMIDAADLALDIPRLADWTYSIGFVHDLPIGNLGTLTSRLNFSHRDDAAFTDNNLGTLNEADMLDASIALTTWNDQIQISVFGKNLLDEVTEGGDTPIPFPLGIGGTFSPLNKGLTWGAEIRYTY